MIDFKAKKYQAKIKFKILCQKYSIKPKDYGERYRRNPKDCINAITIGTFNEDFWFTLPDKRLEAARQKFINILIKNNIEPSGYEKRFRHRISNAAYLLQWNQELDLEYWLTPKEKLSIEEVDEIVKELCNERGIEPEEYEKKYRKLKQKLRTGIRKGEADNKKWVESRFVVSELPNRMPENILSEVKNKLTPGRTVGFILAELPPTTAKRIKAFYPDSIHGINKDLGLKSVPKLKDLDELAAESPSKQQLRIEEINKKIERLYSVINPAKITKLQDELLKISQENDDLSSFEPDEKLLKKLSEGINDALTVSCGYLYLKMWTLPEKTWFKVGITNSPKRRDSEQNVLPVPSQTVYLLRLDSMEQARSVEKAIHKALADRRIRGSLNKELFQLGARDYKALVISLQRLSSKISSASIDEFQEIQKD
tara:strand:+ start:132 stop:1409 length:1278 start_codon:yes stop_codon:yes gene_type:complete